MKNLKMIGLLTIALLFSSIGAQAAGPAFTGECWSKSFYFYGSAGKGSLSGKSAGNAKPIADTDVMSIEAGTLIKNVYVIVDTAVTGMTAMQVGDDDSAGGFIATASFNFTGVGLHNYSANLHGAYLKQTAVSDIYVVPDAKFYQAEGKEIKLDTTTAATAGAFRIVVEGCKVGA